jgi:hypothetical protein
MIIKNSNISKEIFEKTYAQTDHIHDGWWEQRGLVETLKENMHLNMRVKRLDVKQINTWPKIFEDGDFILHIANGADSDNRKITAMREFESRIIK